MTGFLCPADLHTLTGYQRPAKQIEVLRWQGIPFRVNAAGRPVVCWSAVEGVDHKAPEAEHWQPAIMRAA